MRAYRLTPQSIETGIKKQTDALIAATTTLYELSGRDLSRIVVHLVEQPTVNASYRYDEGTMRHRILLYYGLPVFFDKILDGFSARVSSASSEGEVLETPPLDKAHARKISRQLVEAFWKGTLHDVSGFQGLALTPTQERFSVLMVEGILRFVLSHEFGHALFKLAPKTFEAERQWSIQVAQRALNAARMSGAIRNSATRDSWGCEFLADGIGLRIFLHSYAETQAKALALSSAELFLIVASRLEERHQRATHPGGDARLVVLRQLVSGNDSSVLALGRALQSLAEFLFGSG